MADTPEILLDAKRVAEDASTDVDDLVSAALTLLGGGMFEDARRAVVRLEATGLRPQQTRHLKSAIEALSEAGSQFHERLLVTAAKIAKDGSSTPDQLIGAAENLVKWGALDEADYALDRLERAGKKVGGLRAASRQLRRSGIVSSFTPIGHPITETPNRPFEALLSKNPRGSDKAIVVFTGAAARFWLGLNVLHHFLKPFDTHILYLSDHRGRMYLDGLEQAKGYQGLRKLLERTTGDLAVKKIHVMANSAGGFVGLQIARDMRAASFLGMSIRTDLSGQHRLGAYEARAAANCQDKKMLVNLRAGLAASKFPTRINLFCGDSSSLDVEHAENLRGLPNARLSFLEGYSMHDVTPGLLARGLFEPVLNEFMAEQD